MLKSECWRVTVQRSLIRLLAMNDANSFSELRRDKSHASCSTPRFDDVLAALNRPTVYLDYGYITSPSCVLGVASA